jgi:hypothetical protein
VLQILVIVPNLDAARLHSHETRKG